MSLYRIANGNDTFERISYVILVCNCCVAIFVRRHLHDARVCAHGNVRLDVHRRPLPAQCGDGDGVSGSIPTYIVRDTGLGCTSCDDRNLGSIHCQIPTRPEVSRLLFVNLTCVIGSVDKLTDWATGRLWASNAYRQNQLWCQLIKLFATFSHKHRCWWGYNFTSLYWILEGPRLAVLLLNFIFLLNIIRVLIVKLRQTRTSDIEQVRKAVRAAIVLIPLLGITNILNMTEAPLHRTALEFALWSYSTYFLVSFQGFFIAMIYCFLNQEVCVVRNKQRCVCWRKMNYDQRSIFIVAGARGIGEKHQRVYVIAWSFGLGTKTTFGQIIRCVCSGARYRSNATVQVFNRLWSYHLCGQ